MTKINTPEKKPTRTRIGRIRMGGGGVHVFPSWLSFILNNPLRRWLHPPSRVLEKLDVKAHDAVIDFGCGPGFYTIPLARVAKRVIAVDVQREMLEKAARYAEEKNVKVEFLQSDGASIALPDAVADLILLSGVFHELGDRQAVLKELTRLLKDDGRLAVKEKSKRGLIPIGPPIVTISEITDSLKDVGLRVSDKIEIGNDTLVVSIKSLSNQMLKENLNGRRSG